LFGNKDKYVVIRPNWGSTRDAYVSAKE